VNRKGEKAKFFLYMVAELREKAGYNQFTLGKGSRAWNSTIARIENGSTKNLDPVT